jgi:hypothetical protein
MIHPRGWKMSVILLTERHVAHIAGVLSCYDRVIVQGTLPVFCYADGMTAYLTKRSIRIFDFTQFAKPLTDSIKANAEAVAAANGLQIDYVRRKNFRKEDKVKAVLKERGGHPGLVWIFSALEPCTTYQPWHDKKSGRTYLRYDDGKCLHYYFYFIDEELGLCYVRVPTWCPFRLSSTATGTIGWRGSWTGRRSATRRWTTPSPPSRIGRRHSNWQTVGIRQACIASWMSSPSDTARFSNRLRRRITGAWTKPNIPPTSCFTGRQTCKPSMDT